MKMQCSPRFILILLLSILCLPNSFAQNPSQFGLPEGATTRFGKGIAYQIQYAPDGKYLAVASSIGIWLYDTKTYREIALLTGHTKNVTCIDFSPDGKTLASGEGWADYAIRLWDFDKMKQMHALKGHTGDVYNVTFSPNGSTIASGSADNTIHLWDVAKGKHLHTFTGHTGSVNSVVFSKDGRMLISGSDDGTVILWDLTSP